MSEVTSANTSSKKQVRATGEKQDRRRLREIEDLRLVLKTVEGRRLVWRLLTHCRVFSSVLHASGSQVYYNAGQQDIGHFIMAEVLATDENKLIEMMKEAKENYDG